MSDEICYLSVEDLSSAYRTGTLSPVECCTAMLDRIDELNPAINAFFYIDHDGARTAAAESEKRWRSGKPLGPIDGVPIAIKDHILTQGMPSPWGIKPVSMDGPWNEDAPITARLLEDGAVLLGKTTQPEMAAFCSNISSLYGCGRNPWNLAHTPGGSSGGSAAALAAGLCTLAIGSDGGGSIRIPASYTGVVGYKPSFGRVPFYPPMGPGPVYGPMTRQVKDAAIAMNCITRPDWRDSFSLPYDDRDYTENLEGDIDGLKVAYCRTFGFGHTVDAEVALLVDAAVNNLASLGARVEEVAAPFDYNLYNVLAPAYIPQLALQVNALVGDKLDQLLPELQEMVKRASTINLEQSIVAKMQEPVAVLRMAEVFKDFDLIVTPTMPTVAYGAEAIYPDGAELNDVGYCFDHNPFTWIYNLTFQPAVSLPCGLTESGLPVGLQIAGQRHDDVGVLQAAHAYESNFPAFETWPTL